MNSHIKITYILLLCISSNIFVILVFFNSSDVHHFFKKTRPAGSKTTPTACYIVLRRRPSHTGQENLRTPGPPIHSGTCEIRLALEL
jgi:hypothetical protein